MSASALQSSSQSVREIPLTRGLVALVDAENFEWLSQWSWHFSQGYARRGSDVGGTAMHRVVAGAAPGEVVDHINRNTLDNRRCNLRICHQRDNSRNRRGWLTGKSLFKGVSLDRSRGVWVANICIDRRTVFLGRFEKEVDAAYAYDAAARLAFGEFALCNHSEPGGVAMSPETRDRLLAVMKGERKPRGALTKEQRALALARALLGEDYRFIAADYGLSRSAIGGLVFRHKNSGSPKAVPTT